MTSKIPSRRFALAFFFLATVSCGLVAWTFLLPPPSLDSTRASAMTHDNDSPSPSPNPSPSPSPNLTQFGSGEERRNVVLFLVDDLGARDVGAYGSTFHRTPHIDRLASESTLFANAYGAHPKCVPSRVGIFSGTYPARFGLPLQTEMSRYGLEQSYKCFKRAKMESYKLPLQAASLGEAFKEGGYRTAYVGKWHFGKGVKDGTPRHHGFDISVGASDLGAPASYFSPYLKENHKKEKEAPPDLSVRDEGTYLTDHLTDEAIHILDDFHDNKKPFFLVLSHYAVHTPLEAPEDLTKPFLLSRSKLNVTNVFLDDHDAVYKATQDHPIYAAMLASVDDSLGRLRRTLAEKNLTNSTSLIFTSDNGGLASNDKRSGLARIPTSNAPYRHGKTWLYEGGVRVPLIVHAPHHGGQGTVSEARSVGTDLYPTLLDLAGLPLRPKDHRDGVSLLPEIVGRKMDRSDPIFWHYTYGEYDDAGRGDPRSGAVLDGDWKLIDFFDEGKELYNLKEDPYETRNVAKEFPDVKARLMEKLRHWRRHWTKEKKYTPKKCRRMIKRYYNYSMCQNCGKS